MAKNQKFSKSTPEEDKAKEEQKPAAKKERVSYNLRMPSHIYDQLTKEKERTGMSRAAIIYQALAQYFSKK